jgi:hypothetical protein
MGANRENYDRAPLTLFSPGTDADMATSLVNRTSRHDRPAFGLEAASCTLAFTSAFASSPAALSVAARCCQNTEI